MGAVSYTHLDVYKRQVHNDIAYSFNQAYYLLYKAEGKYKEALHYKEICSDMLDSLTLVDVYKRQM